MLDHTVERQEVPKIETVEKVIKGMCHQQLKHSHAMVKLRNRYNVDSTILWHGYCVYTVSIETCRYKKNYDQEIIGWQHHKALFLILGSRRG